MVLGILLELSHISVTGLSPSLAGLPRPFSYIRQSHIEVPQLHQTRSDGLGYTRFARRY
jgi:hypothetical protein